MGLLKPARGLAARDRRCMWRLPGNHAWHARAARSVPPPRPPATRPAQPPQRRRPRAARPRSQTAPAPPRAQRPRRDRRARPQAPPETPPRTLPRRPPAASPPRTAPPAPRRRSRPRWCPPGAAPGPASLDVGLGIPARRRPRSLMKRLPAACRWACRCRPVPGRAAPARGRTPRWPSAAAAQCPPARAAPPPQPVRGAGCLANINQPDNIFETFFSSASPEYDLFRGQSPKLAHMACQMQQLTALAEVQSTNSQACSRCSVQHAALWRPCPSTAAGTARGGPLVRAGAPAKRCAAGPRAASPIVADRPASHTCSSPRGCAAQHCSPPAAARRARRPSAQLPHALTLYLLRIPAPPGHPRAALHGQLPGQLPARPRPHEAPRSPAPAPALTPGPASASSSTGAEAISRLPSGMRACCSACELRAEHAANTRTCARQASCALNQRRRI